MNFNLNKCPRSNWFLSICFNSCFLFWFLRITQNARRKTRNSLIIILLISLFTSGCGTTGRIRRLERLSEKVARQVEASVPVEAPEPAEQIELVKETAIAKEEVVRPDKYRVGEKLSYKIRWMGIPVGRATLEIKDIVEIDGVRCYHFVSRARSNDFLNKIYPVEDVIESYVEVETLISRRFSKYQREGRYRAREKVDFDQANHRGFYYSLKNKTSKEFDILPQSQDALSVLYYFRILKWKAGDMVSVNVSADEKKCVLDIRVLEEQCLEMRNLGVHQALVVEPLLKFEGIFKRRGRVWIWFTNDQQHIPLMMETKVPIIGSITAALEKIE